MHKNLINYLKDKLAAFQLNFKNTNTLYKNLRYRYKDFMWIVRNRLSKRDFMLIAIFAILILVTLTLCILMPAVRSFIAPPPTTTFTPTATPRPTATFTPAATFTPTPNATFTLTPTPLPTLANTRFNSPWVLDKATGGQRLDTLGPNQEVHICGEAETRYLVSLDHCHLSEPIGWVSKTYLKLQETDN